MKYKEQWRIKLLISILISFIGVGFYSILFYCIIQLSIFTILLFMILSLLCIILVSFIGIFIDSMYPKIIWDDEADSLRENYNAFIAMGFSLLFFGLLCGGGYFLFHKYTFSFTSLWFLATVILIISNLLLYLLVSSIVSHFIRDQEV